MSLRITPLGHATVLIENGGRAIVTDPIFSPRIFRLRRQTPLPIDPVDLPALEAIVVSHAHYDHLDLPSLKFITRSVPIILPPGLGKLVRKFVRNPVAELSPGQTFEIRRDLTVTAVPVTHWGFRLLPLRYTQCNGYLIEWGGERIFFPGDTAYRPDFAKLSPVDIALLPIACYRPEWLMKRRHTDPVEAVRIFEEIEARFMIPIHYGTFKLSTEPISEPAEWLRRLAAEKGLTDRIRILPPGESFTLPPRLAVLDGSRQAS